MNMQNKAAYSNVIGNVAYSDSDIGFKKEIKGVMESYTAQGIDITRSLDTIIASDTSKHAFIDALTESMTASPLFTNGSCVNSAFYSNYTDRVGQLMDNTLKAIATESVMTGYAPIVAYNPFFLKKQWIDCVFKDVLMTEIPKTPVVEIGFQRHYLRNMKGEEFALPECLYNDEVISTLMDAATGLNIKEDPIDISLCRNLELLNSTYIVDGIDNDVTMELTPNIHVFAVVMTVDDVEYTVPAACTVDVSTHNFVKGNVSFTLEDGTKVTDELFGRCDFVKGTVTLASTTGLITAVCLRGKTANRFNQRSLDIVRRVEKIEKAMPESGPRLNAAVTIEDAADALALQNVDIIADNVNIMGGTLANFEDAEIKQFLNSSFAAQKAGNTAGIKYNDIDDMSMIVEGGFSAMPAQGYGYTPIEWQKSSREYFERIIGALKLKLRTSNMVIVAVANPNIIRFLQDGINWVFSDDTQISGVKLSYNFGIYTSGQDRVHVITSMRMNEHEGIKFVAIPLTQELITFKHYKYNVTIDRNYRNPLYSLTPNIMCTQRTLNFEILPLQGHMDITGRELFSPNSFLRDVPVTVTTAASDTTTDDTVTDDTATVTTVTE